MSNIEDDSFRDSIGTINEKGKRKFIFPKKPRGKFYDKRKLVSYVLLVLLLSSPFIKINGNQFLLFNVLDRRFNIFGMPFWPQDFYLVVVIMIVGVVGLTLFTVAFGRVFCGWFCPQTIFMEMVFRRIEYWIDGDRGAQIKLDNQEWNADLRSQIIKFLDGIKGPTNLIEKFTVMKIEQDKTQKDRILLDIHITPYFPAKSFVIQLDGHKGDGPEEAVWHSDYKQV